MIPNAIYFDRIKDQNTMRTKAIDRIYDNDNLRYASQ